MPAPILKVVADTPESDQGEMAESPSAEPSATSISVKAAAVTEPAAIAGHETPEVCISTTVALFSVTMVAGRIATSIDASFAWGAHEILISLPFNGASSEKVPRRHAAIACCDGGGLERGVLVFGTV